ncbi:MAG: translocation/assembly module TamB domain-containing protein [Geminicoccaceae bacterium]|nr:translocation/assembly module TamB domain-containing protein [Geminicoccaceae bacterium]
MADGPDVRAGRLSPAEYERNFADAHPPLTAQQAMVEAARCLFCYDAPCIEACPTGIDIPRFIRGIQTGNLRGAAETILEANIMGGTCARVCPTDVLCEGACVRLAEGKKPVEIGALQRHAVDWLFERGIQPFSRGAPTGERVAVVGAGLAGLACAHALARLGHQVVVFEKRAKAGGLNEYGIAAYKMAHDFAQREVDFILGIGGIELRTGIELGRDVTLAELRRDFAAVFLGLGLQGVHALGLEGERLSGVIDAVAYIERLRQAKDLATLPVGRRVVVIGGGNTAIDIAVQTKRLGAETVTIVYRRGPASMSATPHEQEWAKSNGVLIRHWARPVAIEGAQGHVRAVTFERTRLDGQGRLEGTGEVALAGLAWRLRLEARGFQVLANELGNAVVSGTAEANGRGAEGALRARLEVERAEIRIPDPPPAVPATIPVEEIGRGARHEIEPAAPPAPPFALDVRIRAENQVFVRGRGLESEWFGDVRARGTLAEPDVVGRIELRRGRLDLLGSRFVLKEGLIEFDGAKPPLPRLDVVGEARKADITARVGLRGRAPKFDIVMESEPPLPRDEILARVLFGREMARITPIQAAVLANSVATLQGGGIDALSPVRGAIGLDTLDVGGDDNGGAAIRAGKYVTERVYVEMQRGVTPESSRARVEVDLGNNLRGTTEVRETGRTGFGIEWRYDY